MTYKDIVDKALSLRLVGLEVFSIGKSLLGRDIYATHVGSFNGPQVIIQGGIHAREYISSLLVIDLARMYSDTPDTYGGIYFVFATDPDGIAIVLDGLDSVRCVATRQYLLAINGSDDFSQYKANANAVDLNTNFDAQWGSGTQNVTCPQSGDFIGFYPESERETRVLSEFTIRNSASLTISYHSKGNVIFWGFGQMSQSDQDRDRLIGEELSSATGYMLVLTENSAGGYKDWCIEDLKIPSYTIEVGSPDLAHPISIAALPEILSRNKDVPKIALSSALSLDR